jgi:hypothetical protein
MKISPLAAGLAGIPGQNLNQSTSNSKIEAAKQIAAGETPVQQTIVDPQVARAETSIRKIKMKSDYSPERFNDVIAASQVQENTSEVTAPSATADVTEQVNATTEETKPLSPQFAALAKQRRALQVKERELADREKALESKSSTSGGEDYKARLKSEPLRVLEEAGVTYDQLTEAILAQQGGINPEIQALKAEIKALKEGVDTKFTERETQAEQQVLNEMRREATILAKAGDTYEMVRETQSVPEVIELIHRTYKQTGEVLDVSEAMQLVEDHLVNETLKIANLKKIQSKITPAQESVQQQPQVKSGMKTLTNRDNAKPILDRRSRAIAAMQGTLKK